MKVWVYKFVTDGRFNGSLVEYPSDKGNIEGMEFIGVHEKQIDKPKKVVTKEGWVSPSDIRACNDNCNRTPKCIRIKYEVEE